LRRLHNEFHNLNASQNIIRAIKSRRMRWVGHVARIREMRNAYDSLVTKLERKRPSGRPKRNREDTIRMDVGEIG
jgi:hypothetical protein